MWHRGPSQCQHLAILGGSDPLSDGSWANVRVVRSIMDWVGGIRTRRKSDIPVLPGSFRTAIDNLLALAGGREGLVFLVLIWLIKIHRGVGPSCNASCLRAER